LAVPLDFSNLSPLTTALVISFLAELGDKSQIMTLVLAAQSRSIKKIFFGAFLAEITVVALGIGVGTFLAYVIEPPFLQLLGGLIFILFGIYTLLSRDFNGKMDGLIKTRNTGFWTAFSLIGLAELGDKTQIAAIGLTAEFGTPVLVFLGFIISLFLLSLTTAVLGERASKFIPIRRVRIISGFIFLSLGVIFLLGLRV